MEEKETDAERCSVMGSSASRGESNETPAEMPSWARYTNVPFRLLGYGILMGWHFLLIYFLTVPEVVKADLVELFQRQLGLNTALALAFFVLFYMGRRVELISKLLSIPVVLVSGGLGAVSTAGAMYCATHGLFPAMIAFTALSGCAEALLLFSWLHFYSESSNNYATQYLAFSLVIGSLVAFFIHHLTIDVALVCFAVLPAISAVMLVSSIFQTPARSAEAGERGLADHEGAKAPLVTCTAHLAVYSAIFGFLQGSMLPNGEPLLAAFTPNTVIGTGIAGAVTMLVFHKVKGKRAPELLRRLAVFLFAMGILSTVYPWPITKEIAGMAIMAGFMIIDITALVYVVRLIRAYDMTSGFAIGFNRCVEYATFAVAITLGAATTNAFGDNAIYPLVVSGVSTLIVLGYALACMGQGKLDWIDRLYPTVPDARWLDDADDADGEKAPFGEGGGATDVNAASTSADDQNESARPALGRFKTRCRIVCERASLSPREVEVFMLMAKGRNAEYIQGALTISNYTAKTHIANIYRKCEVHSLQELIDEVEQAEI